MNESDPVGSPIKRMIPVEKVCVVGDMNKDTLNLLKEYDIELMFSQTGREYNEDLDVVFLLARFDQNKIFEDLYENVSRSGHITSNVSEKPLKIMGPLYARYFLLNERPIPHPSPNRPRYCVSMNNVSAVIEVRSDKNFKRRIVDLVHFMGGSARKDVIQKTTHFVSDAARGKNFRIAVSLGMHLVRPSFVFEAWSQRDCPEFDMNNQAFLAKHRISCFEGIRLYLVGFQTDQIHEMTEIVLDKKGTIVTDSQQATHIVYEPNCLETMVALSSQQQQVTAKWFWQSLEAGFAVSESEFWPGGSKKLNKSDRKSHSSILDNSNCSVLSDFSGDDLSRSFLYSSPVKMDKKHHVVQEMLGTEERYIEALELLLNMRNRLVGVEGGTDSWIDKNTTEGITKADINTIFGKIPPIVQLHKQICNNLRVIVNNWRPRQSIGSIWSDFQKDFLKVYPPFINTYDMAKARFEEIDKNEKFHAFVRTCETDPSWQRARVADLLIRPLQRLPSVVLLLNECLKRTERGRSDQRALPIAIRSLEAVLGHANESRRLTENYEKMMKFFDDIINIPSDLLSSSRHLVNECTIVSHGGARYWKDCNKKILKLLLFNDILMVCKMRECESQSNRGGTISRMQRHFSSASIFGEEKKRKKLKYYAHFGIEFVRKILEINIGDDQNQAYLLLTRDEFDDSECVVSVDPTHGSTTKEVQDFMRCVEQTIFHMTGRENVYSECDLENVSDYYCDIVMKCLQRKFNPNVSLMGPPMSTRRPNTGSFRRAISNASFTIMKPFHNGSNSRQSLAPTDLRNIAEYSICDSPSGDPCSPRVLDTSRVQESPRRGLKSRITSSAFYERTLGRRSSIRDKRCSQV